VVDREQLRHEAGLRVGLLRGEDRVPEPLVLPAVSSPISARWYWCAGPSRLSPDGEKPATAPRPSAFTIASVSESWLGATKYPLRQFSVRSTG
jgi:hypothetical protein